MDDHGEVRGVDPRFDITTEEDLAAILHAVLAEADSNGVEVCGGWPVLRNGDGASWDIEVTRLSR